MRSTSTAERGFALVELVLCVAVLALAAAATAGAFAALARNASPPSARDAALMVAENALVRARAAVVYAASASSDPVSLLADRSWGLVPGETDYLAGADLRAPLACGDANVHALRFPVAATYDPAAERFTVAVTYPRDPCRHDASGAIAAGDALTVTLAETLPPSVYPPGQTVYRDVAPPARM